MPLEILLVLVIGGIAAIAVLTHLMGYSRGLSFADDAMARAHWLRQFPDDPPTAIHLSDDARAALIETRAGPGLLWVMGADSTAHRLTGADLRDTATGLYIDLHDFAAPGLAVRLSPEARATWRALIPTPTDAQGMHPA